MRNPYDAIGRIGLLLAIAGAVNWLLVGLFEWNLVKWVFTQSGTQTVDTTGERIVYIVVGAGAILALPMLAATLARSRSRDVRRDESERSRRDVAEDDTSFYYGAPKTGGVPSPLRAQEGQPQPTAYTQSQPVRKTERVIIRTEEPMTTSGESRPITTSAESERLSSSADESLRYGTVEETDDEYGEGYDQQERRAA